MSLSLAVCVVGLLIMFIGLFVGKPEPASTIGKIMFSMGLLAYLLHAGATHVVG